MHVIKSGMMQKELLLVSLYSLVEGGKRVPRTRLGVVLGGLARGITQTLFGVPGRGSGLRSGCCRPIGGMRA